MYVLTWTSSSSSRTFRVFFSDEFSFAFLLLVSRFGRAATEKDQEHEKTCTQHFPKKVSTYGPLQAAPRRSSVSRAFLYDNLRSLTCLAPFDLDNDYTNGTYEHTHVIRSIASTYHGRWIQMGDLSILEYKEVCRPSCQVAE